MVHSPSRARFSPSVGSDRALSQSASSMVRPIGEVRLATSLVVVAALIAGGCGTSPPRITATPAQACAVVTAPSAPVDSASIVVTSTVDARNAPRPTTWGERFVFGLAFDTVPRLDCHGRPVADVAGPYRVREAGRSIVLLEPTKGARGPRLTIHAANEASARDLVDAGVDLLITDSPALASYASTRAEVSEFRWAGIERG